MSLELLWSPFVEFAFMRRALLGGVALAVSAAPLGVFLVLRRLSLMGDAIAHGILPGAALGFWLFGLSLPALTLGGLAAGLGMAGLAAWIPGAPAWVKTPAWPPSTRFPWPVAFCCWAWPVTNSTCCTCCSARCWLWTHPPSTACCWCPAAAYWGWR